MKISTQLSRPFRAFTQSTKEARTPILSFLSSSASCNVIFLSDVTPNSSLETFLQPLAGQTFRLFLHLAVSSCVARQQRWGNEVDLLGKMERIYISNTLLWPARPMGDQFSHPRTVTSECGKDICGSRASEESERRNSIEQWENTPTPNQQKLLHNMGKTCVVLATRCLLFKDLVTVPFSEA